MRERWQLALERIREIKTEKRLEGNLQEYFEQAGDFLLLMEKEEQRFLSGEKTNKSLEELQEENRAVYADLIGERYAASYANPEFACRQLGTDYGPLFSAAYAELYSLPAYLAEGKTEPALIRVELFLEIYGLCLQAAEDKTLPAYDSLKEIFFWFAHDYAEDILREDVKQRYDTTENWAGRFLDRTDVSDLRYLYLYGEYISENELEMARYMNRLPLETVQKMADTYTEGYIRGFEAYRKDLSKKKAANVIYPLGMERMVKLAMENLRKKGLEPILYRAPVSFFAGRRLYKSGYSGAVANRQFEYDHEYDRALYLNSRYLSRKLSAYQTVLEEYKRETGEMAGPAVIESFGESPFVPLAKEENLRLDERRQKQEVEYLAKAGELVNRYVKGEERSFTIIAFPSPAIGEQFEDIFHYTIRLNTLDNDLYTRYQQAIIDVLDQADHVLVEGFGENETSIRVALPYLADPASQTNFENCVADVNIPVGEVFTSPRLEGTQGLLHVPRVFLHGMEYRNLRLTFENGMIRDYSCDNFENPEEGKKLIREKLLHHHETLPLGEFAIGTNTTAYRMAKDYGIGALLPILIAEKTGPHFAIGDTCFCRQEDMPTYNPDGKQMMAKENSCSAKRKTDVKAAYFNCHTDITIPYEELGLVAAVKKGGEILPVIEKGRFVLPECVELNKPFDE